MSTRTVTTHSIELYHPTTALGTKCIAQLRQTQFLTRFTSAPPILPSSLRLWLPIPPPIPPPPPQKWIGADSWIGSQLVDQASALGAIGTFPMEPRDSNDCRGPPNDNDGSAAAVQSAEIERQICRGFISRWESSVFAESYAAESAGLVVASFVNQSRNLMGKEKLRTTVSDADVAALLNDTDGGRRRADTSYAPSTYDAMLGVAAMLFTTGCIDHPTPRGCLDAAMPTHSVTFVGTTGQIRWDPVGKEAGTGIAHGGDRVEASNGTSLVGGQTGSAKYQVLSRDIQTYNRDLVRAREAGTSVSSSSSPIAEERGRVRCTTSGASNSLATSTSVSSNASCSAMSIAWGHNQTETAITLFVHKKDGDGSNLKLFLKSYKLGGYVAQAGSAASSSNSTFRRYSSFPERNCVVASELPNATAYCLFNTTRLDCRLGRGMHKPDMLPDAPWIDGYQKDLGDGACWFDDFSIYPTHGCSDTVRSTAVRGGYAWGGWRCGKAHLTRAV